MSRLQPRQNSMKQEAACKSIQSAYKGGVMKQKEKCTWVTPTLVGKAVSQTLSGMGSDHDGRGGEFQS
ncbi:MAG: hypothetical protein ABI742_03905 [Gemmatimonadota bacterium]